MQVPESSSCQSKKVGIVHNPQGREAAEACLTPEVAHCTSSQDEGDADDPLQELGCLASRGRLIGIEGIPILDMEVKSPVQTSGVLPTDRSPSHPSYGRTQNTSLVRPVQDMCSGEVGNGVAR